MSVANAILERTKLKWNKQERFCSRLDLGQNQDKNKMIFDLKLSVI